MHACDILVRNFHRTRAHSRSVCVDARGQKCKVQGHRECAGSQPLALLGNPLLVSLDSEVGELVRT